MMKNELRMSTNQAVSTNGVSSLFICKFKPILLPLSWHHLVVKLSTSIAAKSKKKKLKQAERQGDRGRLTKLTGLKVIKKLLKNETITHYNYNDVKHFYKILL